VKSFLGKVQTLMGRGLIPGEGQIRSEFQALERQAAAANPGEAYGIRSKAEGLSSG